MRALLTIVLLAAMIPLGCAPLIASVPIEGTDQEIKVWSWPVGESQICVSYPGKDNEPSLPPEEQDVEPSDCPRPAVSATGGHVSDTFRRMMEGIGLIVGSVFGGTRVAPQ